MMAKILYAEDENILREATTEMLREDRFVVSPHANADTALQAFLSEGKGAFDVILTDDSMPGKSGVELVREIRKTDKTVPVILLSSTPKETIASACPDFDDLNITYAVKHETKIDALELLIDGQIARRTRGDFGPT